MVQWVRTHLHYGSDSIPGPGTSMCCECSKKKKKEREKVVSREHSGCGLLI